MGDVFKAAGVDIFSLAGEFDIFFHAGVDNLSLAGEFDIFLHAHRIFLHNELIGA